MNTKCEADFGVIGWKAYKNVKKKAMEQEFSLSGLLISLSIAFFIVIASAYLLSFLYQNIEYDKQKDQLLREKVHYSELNKEVYFSEFS